jgi:hypothetical protein
MITPFLHTPRTENQKSLRVNLSPGSSTIEKILQYAATHRVEKVPENNHIDYFLN